MREFGKVLILKYTPPQQRLNPDCALENASFAIKLNAVSLGNYYVNSCVGYLLGWIRQNRTGLGIEQDKYQDMTIIRNHRPARLTDWL